MPEVRPENGGYLENARVWKCYADHDRPKFSLKTGTVFEDSPLGLDKWLPALWCSSPQERNPVHGKFTALWASPRRPLGSCCNGFGSRCRIDQLAASWAVKSK